MPWALTMRSIRSWAVSASRTDSSSSVIPFRPGRPAILVVALLGGVACGHRKSQGPVSSAAEAVEILPDETLGVDDVFEVRVIGEADLSGPYRIAVDGTVDYPYLGRLNVAGQRPGDVQQLLTKRLKEGFLVAPQVSVMVKEWNSRKISVLGQVNKPGPVVYYPKMTIMDAIAAAGGFTAIAAQNAVKLRREHRGRVETATFRLTDISEGRSPNVVLLPRDVLFVDERMF
jgi:protein involved in polysaccharide export with SLBB domain